MKIIFYILIIGLFFSCQSKRILRQSNIQHKADIQNQISDRQTTHADAAKSITDIISDSVETVIKTTIYDSDKPVIEATGKPPVKQEITTTQRKVGKRTVQTNVGLSVSQETVHSDSSKKTENIFQQEKLSEKTKPPDFKYLFYTLVLLFIIAIVVVVYLKWSKIKAFIGYFHS